MPVKPRSTPIGVDLILFLAAGVLLLIQLMFLARDLRTVTLDVTCCYLPWYEHVFSEGRFGMLEASFANYSPPTIYLFSLLSFFDGITTRTILLKLLNAPFILGSGWLGYGICRLLGAARTRAAAVALLLMVAPEVWQNSFRWGQYDAVFTFFLLAFYYLTASKRPVAAMVLFGTAFAFKLQAVFAGPILLALWLTGEISLWMFAIIPAMYLLWMVPAHLAGRSWRHLMTIYFGQFDTFPQLSVDAPNLYFLLQKYVPAARFHLASNAATLLAMAASVALALAYWRRPRTQTAQGLLTAMAVCLLMVPFLLPRMHERYFFAGGAFAILMIALRPAIAFPVILLQLTAYLTYRQYFLTFGYGFVEREFILPVVMMTVALIWIVLQFWREGSVSMAPAEPLKAAQST